MNQPHRLIESAAPNWMKFLRIWERRIDLATPIEGVYSTKYKISEFIKEKLIWLHRLNSYISSSQVKHIKTFTKALKNLFAE